MKFEILFLRVFRFFVMFGDVLIIGTIAICIASLNPALWVISYLGYKAWEDSGAFSAWNFREIRESFRM